MLKLVDTAAEGSPKEMDTQPACSTSLFQPNPDLQHYR